MITENLLRIAMNELSDNNIVFNIIKVSDTDTEKGRKAFFNLTKNFQIVSAGSNKQKLKRFIIRSYANYFSYKIKDVRKILEKKEYEQKRKTLIRNLNTAYRS